jgi:hypothetical protein
MKLSAPSFRSAVTGASALLLLGCSSPARTSDDEENVAQRYDGEEHGGETYPEYDERRDSYEGARGKFGDEGCTVDCSGHEAGYAWAEDKGITDPDDCGGKSWSFIEGCRAYAEEQSADDGNNDEQ